MSKMPTWLEEFADKQSKQAQKTIQASAKKLIVSANKIKNAHNDMVIKYKGAKYKVVNANYVDSKGKGIMLEKIADLEGNPMEVAVGTAVDYTTNPDMTEQEYARVNPEIQDVDPRDVEVSKFNEEAINTENEIEVENSIDATTGDTYPNRIIQKLVEKYAPTYIDNGGIEPAVTDTNVVDVINDEKAYEEPINEGIDDTLVDFEQVSEYVDTIDGVNVDDSDVNYVDTIDDVEYIDDEDFDGEYVEEDDDSDPTKLEKPDATLVANKKKNRILARLQK